LKKFVAEEKRTTEVQLKDNGFWLGYLNSQYQNKDDVKQVLNYVESLKKITPESIKATAVKYLNGKNFIQFVLLPEKK